MSPALWECHGRCASPLTSRPLFPSAPLPPRPLAFLHHRPFFPHHLAFPIRPIASPTALFPTIAFPSALVPPSPRVLLTASRSPHRPEPRVPPAGPTRTRTAKRVPRGGKGNPRGAAKPHRPPQGRRRRARATARSRPTAAKRTPGPAQGIIAGKRTTPSKAAGGAAPAVGASVGAQLTAGSTHPGGALDRLHFEHVGRVEKRCRHRRNAGATSSRIRSPHWAERVLERGHVKTLLPRLMRSSITFR
ncbi:hypothetical protein LSCM4_06543 [Leishmania orientalis]|uniref:Uncharacterized protein n=1 Tax=Leishmania orientalis TaxID=2249476 RepID=A0A836KTZ7_9TRYP|nr:hypothetical protein LSCM4_06543 [Leishmania orientalis]